MIQMISVELDDEDQLDAVMPIAMPEKPRYPYGLKICITEKEFEKLNLDPSDAVIGGIFHGHFLARITGIFKNETDSSDACCRVEAQIEDLAIESEDEEDDED